MDGIRRPVLSRCRSRSEAAEHYWREALELTQLAEQLGFTNVRTVEHYFQSYGGYSPDPLIFLSAAAAMTRSMRLVTGAVLPVFNNPLKLAGQIGMVDAISGGRLEVGFARAFLPHEFARFGISMDESRARFDEGLEQIRRLLEEEQVTARGRFHSFEGVTSLPRPTQKPRPPFWIAALSTKESFENAGRSATTSWAFRSPARTWPSCCRSIATPGARAGHPGRGKVMLAFHMFCAETREKAAAIAREPLNHYLKSIVDAASDWMSGVSSTRLSQLPENDPVDLRRNVRVAGRKGRGLDRHARRHPQRHRSLRSRGRRLRIRLAAGQFWHDRPRRGRAVDAAVCARGDAALCAAHRRR